MADLRVRTIDESELDTILAADVEFEGDVEFDRPLLVKGTVRGTITSPSDLYVSEGASIEANVTARRVSVKGAVVGDVTASNRIELFSDASLHGNIRTPDLIIQSGSHFTGSCNMSVESQPPEEKPAEEPTDRDNVESEDEPTT